MSASCETIWAAKVLEIENLTVRYGAFLAVDRVSLAVGEGIIVGLVGPNGAGKSSLVRVVSGLVRPATGAVRFREQSLDGIPPHGRVDRGIAVVPEGRGLFPQMSVEESKGFRTIMELFNGHGRGSRLMGVEGTAWGLLNAVTEYTDHHMRARSAENRLSSAWFGVGANLKAAAEEALLLL